MKNKSLVFQLLVVVLISITACNPDTNPITPNNPLIGKVKKVTVITSTSNTSSEFFYNATTIALDSILVKDSTHNIRATLRYSYTGNKIVSKTYIGGMATSDSVIYSTSNNRLDSVETFQNSSRLLKTYSYDGTGTLLYYKDFLSNPTALPTNTIFSNGNLLSTNFTNSYGPNPFQADTTTYSYTNHINNLVPSAFSLNFSGMLSLGFYNVDLSKNLASETVRSVYIGNNNNPTIITVTQRTTITYSFDTQDRVIQQVNTISTSTPAEVTTQNIEYYE